MTRPWNEEDVDKLIKGKKKFWNPKTHRWQNASSGLTDTRMHPKQFTSETSKKAIQAKKEKHARTKGKGVPFTSETGREAARKRWHG